MRNHLQINIGCTPSGSAAAWLCDDNTKIVFYKKGKKKEQNIGSFSDANLRNAH